MTDRAGLGAPRARAVGITPTSRVQSPNWISALRSISERSCSAIAWKTCRCTRSGDRYYAREGIRSRPLHGRRSPDRPELACNRTRSRRRTDLARPQLLVYRCPLRLARPRLHRVQRMAQHRHSSGLGILESHARGLAVPVRSWDVPLVQWIAIPSVAFWLARRHGLKHKEGIA